MTIIKEKNFSTGKEFFILKKQDIPTEGTSIKLEEGLSLIFKDEDWLTTGKDKKLLNFARGDYWMSEDKAKMLSQLQK